MLVGELEMKSWKLMERRYGVCDGNHRISWIDVGKLCLLICCYELFDHVCWLSPVFSNKNKRDPFVSCVDLPISNKSGSSQVRSNRAIQNAVRRVVAQKKLPVNFKVRRWAVPDGSRGMIQLTNKGRSFGWYSKSW